MQQIQSDRFAEFSARRHAKRRATRRDAPAVCRRPSSEPHKQADGRNSGEQQQRQQQKRLETNPPQSRPDANRRGDMLF